MSKRKVAKQKFYVCDKKSGGTWFTCDSSEEAREWIQYAPMKVGEPKNKFYIRRDKIQAKGKRYTSNDIANEDALAVNQRKKQLEQNRDRLFN